MVKALRTAGDRGLEGGETVADLPVAPGECKRIQVGRHLVTRVVSPPGQHQTFPQPQHLKVPHLSRAVRQGLCPTILPNWPPNTVARDGKRTYYKYNVASYKEAEWVRLRDKFFTHFLPHKEEALGIKERCPMDYMPYIEEQFWRATGLHLNGLRVLRHG